MTKYAWATGILVVATILLLLGSGMWALAAWVLETFGTETALLGLAFVLLLWAMIATGAALHYWDRNRSLRLANDHLDGKLLEANHTLQEERQERQERQSW